MDQCNHLLVIRLSAMGDVAMTVPVLRALTSTYPELKITVLTKAFFEPIFSDLDNVAVIAADVKGRHKGVLGLWKLYKELKPLQIEAVADLHNVLRSNILKRYFRWGGIRFVQVNKGRKAKKALTALRNKKFRPLKTTHQRYVDVFEKLGFQIKLAKTHVMPKLSLPETVLKLVGHDSSKWLGIAPFAAFSGKMYPLELMEAVVGALNNTKGYKIFFFGGGPTEKRILNEWQGKYPNSVNVAGRLSLTDELALISNLDLMLGMDSGNAHLAAMYGIPTVTLWGVTHPYAGFYPFAQDTENALISDRERYPLIPTSVYGNKVPKGYDNVMATIQPDDVVNKVNLLLRQ